MSLRLIIMNIEAAIGGKPRFRERFWKKSSQCREIMLQVNQVMASFCCYDNSDVIATLIITRSRLSAPITTNFHLYPRQLWWQFFQIFDCGDVRSLCSNSGGMDPEKLYRATLKQLQNCNNTQKTIKQISVYKYYKITTVQRQYYMKIRRNCQGTLLLSLLHCMHFSS